MRKGSNVVIIGNTNFNVNLLTMTIIYYIYIGTENVRSRTPHLIGRIGIVKEAPVHPATWYKIEVNGEILTFRPSALRAYHGNETEVSSFYLENYQQEILKEKEVKAEKVLRNKNTPRYSSIKKVRKSRQQRIPRGLFLSSLSQDQWLHTEVRCTQGNVAGILGKVSSVLDDDQVIITSGTDGSEFACDTNQLLVMRSDNDDDDDTTLSADDNESIDEIPFPTTNFGKRTRKINTILNQKRNDVQAKYRKVSSSDMDLVQNIMKTIMSPEFEKEAIHEFMSSCCQTCFAEKWNGAKFCWNENCMSSPIYWKRTGAPLSVTDDMKPFKIIDTFKSSNDENVNENITVSKNDLVLGQTPATVPLEPYRPMIGMDALYCTSLSDLRERGSKSRSDSNVTDIEGFSPLPKGDDYYSENEIESEKQQSLADRNVTRMII